MSTIEHFGTIPKKVRGRGKAKASIAIITAAYDFLEVQNPTSVRGVQYHLFNLGLIPSMGVSSTKRVSRLLTDAREDGTIPWHWIVDEKREIEGVSTWADGEHYIQTVRRAYRRDFWAQQPRRVLLVSEKGTVRGTVRPVTDEYGVDFLSLSGFGGAGIVHQLAQDYSSQPLVIFYVGDRDPSGMFMSEVDLPGRIARYGGDHIRVERIALLPDDLPGLPSFPAASKSKDSRCSWFTKRYGQQCWELDAMPPNELRDRVERAIQSQIEPEAWDRCVEAQEAEQQSLESLLDQWSAA
jgi:hypothetical protein